MRSFGVVPKYDDRLRQLRKRGLQVEIVYNCGAFLGIWVWAARVADSSPEAEYGLIGQNREEIGHIED